ncbi:MAG: tyrosine-type recombinase/integrase [Candidatus Methanoperedens sp.]|nr:tyrosine-type recombinase/integrase [Candidatus Methanoperedens sp.]MCZ7404880.1 tyrosine-type recombinase/integrase [Candidatus Methanoperedens sp.]
MININDELKNFSKDCESRGLTKHTVQTYLCNIKVFLNHVQGNPFVVDTNTLRDFLDYLKNMDYIRGKNNLKGVCNQTMNAYFSAISTYYDFLIYTGKTSNNPVIPFRKRYLAKQKRQYNGENSRQLISIPQMKQLINQDMPIQHKIILLIMAKTGVRRGELLSMDIDDINLVRKEIVLKPKAKRTNRLVFFDDETAGVLKIYLKWRESRAKSRAVFISPYGNRMHKDTINDIVGIYALKLGLHDPNGNLNKKLTAHCFRHFFTTHLRRAGMPREFIQELRGDSRNEAIDIYDHIGLDELREAYNDCIPSIIEGTVTLHVRDTLPQPTHSLSIAARLRLVGESTALFGEITIGILSALKEAPEGMTPIQITRQIKRKYKSVERSISRHRKNGQISRDETGKYFITPKGIKTLELTLDKIEADKTTEDKKPEPDKNTELLNYILKERPDIVNAFFNQASPQVTA